MTVRSATRGAARVAVAKAGAMQVLKPQQRFENRELSTAKANTLMGPGYYDNRYWLMWKLPMFGCNDSDEVLKEIAECKKEYPDCRIKVIAFDHIRQVQCAGFIVQT